MVLLVPCLGPVQNLKLTYLLRLELLDTLMLVVVLMVESASYSS